MTTRNPLTPGSTGCGSQRQQPETMLPMKFSLVFFAPICFTSCSTAIKQCELPRPETSYAQQTIEQVPIVDVKISLIDTALKYGEDIMLNISLTNNTKNEQKLLFDKPEISTGGPWETTGEVIDIKTKSSVLKHKNKAMLSSNIFADSQLVSGYYHLKPGQTLSRRYNMMDIVVPDCEDNSLPVGTYEAQLFYHINPSNILKIKIQ